MRRINERNSGHLTLNGERKERNSTLKLTDSESKLLKALLFKIEESLEHDKSNGKGHLSPESEWIDGGRFTLKMTGEELKLMQSAFKKL